jgi:LacI family purine nucleotide synthesis repressor
MASVTLKDIASLVGVSVNTVSRALKDKPYIEETTRQRIRDAATALGYRPNLNARSLVLKKTSIIGVAVTEPDNPVRMEFCEKLRVIAGQAGYRLLIAGISVEINDRDISIIEDLLGRGVDGLVIGYLDGLLAEQPVGRILRECDNNNTPVTVFGTAETGLADSVYIDFYESGYRLTSYLLELGKTPIAFLGDRHDQRRQGYFKAMEDHGRKDEAFSWEIKGHRLSSGRDAVEKYLEKFKRPPDAIVAPNDLAAIGIISVLKSHGWKVPQDTSVAGFDNIEIGAYYDPPLTSIGFDNGLFAESVWQLISSRLKSKEQEGARCVKLHQELIVRGSCS